MVLSAMECILKIPMQVALFELAQCNDALHMWASFFQHFSLLFFDRIVVLSFCHSPGPQFCLKARKTDSEEHTLTAHDTSVMELTFLKHATDVCVLRCY